MADDDKDGEEKKKKDISPLSLNEIEEDDRAKQAAIYDLLADFDVSTIPELEDAVADLVATATDARGHVDERLVRLEFKMRASRRAGRLFEQRGGDPSK